MELWNIEKEYLDAGLAYVCGVDEAGAGPLAGPVYAAAVILPPYCEIEGLNDSKKLTEKKREKLFDIIRDQAVAYSIARVEAEEIDETDILSARMKAMQLAIDALGVKADFALIDGNRETDFGIPCQTVVKGDSRSANIAAASVLAKVTRDIYMEDLAEKYPQYGFEIHKGYGTKAHYAALTAHGMCDAHRRSFLRKFYGER